MPAGALARTPTHRPAITRRRIASRRRTRRRRLASVFLQSLRVSRPGHPFSVAPHHVQDCLAEAKPARDSDRDIVAAGGIVAHCRSHEYALFSRPRTRRTRLLATPPVIPAPGERRGAVCQPRQSSEQNLRPRLMALPLFPWFAPRIDHVSDVRQG